MKNSGMKCKLQTTLLATVMTLTPLAAVWANPLDGAAVNTSAGTTEPAPAENAKSAATENSQTMLYII